MIAEAEGRSPVGILEKVLFIKRKEESMILLKRIRGRKSSTYSSD
jgi:hypothetical protein